MGVNTLVINGPEWKTPLTKVPDTRVGRARIRRDSQARGYYRLEGVAFDSEVYQVVKGRMPVTLLERKTGDIGGFDLNGHRAGQWKVWMLDDPLHWYGMGERVADLPPGKVLCAGLGLGLMVHHLVARDDVTKITVVEIDSDVVELVSPTLPKDPRIDVVQADYYHYIETIPKEDRPDSVLWDLAVGSHEETKFDFMRAEAMTAVYLPDVPLFRFGERKEPRPSWLNP